jgi:hypothetical protein
MLQTRNDRLRRLNGAARYMEIVWNPLNIVSHAPYIATRSEWQRLSNDSAVIYR